jgi:hypothetical protein
MQFNMPMPRDLASWFARIQKAANPAQVTTNADEPPAELNSHDEEE